MQKTMVAQSRFPYRQKILEPGDEFTPETEGDAFALRTLGKAKDKDEESKRTYRRRDMRAEQ